MVTYGVDEVTVQMIESPEVEKEVKRLLRADTFADSVCILVQLYG